MFVSAELVAAGAAALDATGGSNPVIRLLNLIHSVRSGSS
jgi:hypothetical protein